MRSALSIALAEKGNPTWYDLCVTWRFRCLQLYSSWDELSRHLPPTATLCWPLHCLWVFFFPFLSKAILIGTTRVHGSNEDALKQDFSGSAPLTCWPGLFLVVGTALGTIGCLAASLGSTHRHQELPLTSMTAKMSLDIVRCPLEGKLSLNWEPLP